MAFTLWQQHNFLHVFGERHSRRGRVCVLPGEQRTDVANAAPVQLRAFDSAKSGSAVGVGVLLALCSSLLQKSIKGGLAVTGGLNLGGSIETIFNPVAVVEIAIEKGAASILMPISSRRQLNDLPDELAAKITIHYYLDARNALLKALAV